MPNLRSEARYRASLWDWSAYNDCFGDTSIRLSDMDGIVERKGHILFIETKRPNEPIPQGQRILFSALARLPNCRMLIVYGEPNHPIAYQLWDYHTERQRGNEETLRNLMKRWFAYANAEAVTP